MGLLYPSGFAETSKSHTQPAPPPPPPSPPPPPPPPPPLPSQRRVGTFRTSDTLRGDYWGVFRRGLYWGGVYWELGV